MNEIATGFDADSNATTLVKVTTNCPGSGRGAPVQHYLACWTVTFDDAGAIASKEWLATSHWSGSNPSIPCPVAADPAAIFSVADGAGQFPETLSTTTVSGSYRAVLDAACAPISFGQTRSGTIDVPGGTSCYAFRAKDGDSVRVTAGATAGTLKPIAAVTRPDGTALCGGEGAVDCAIDSAGRHVIAVADVDGTATGGFDVSLSCTSPSCTPFDYALGHSSDVTITSGGTGSTTVTATLAGGFTEAVTFAIAGLPSGASASFDVGSCAPDCTTTLTITVPTSVEIGSFPITISADPLGRATTFTLTVTEATPACGGTIAGGPGAPGMWPALALALGRLAARRRRRGGR